MLARWNGVYVFCDAPLTAARGICDAISPTSFAASVCRLDAAKGQRSLQDSGCGCGLRNGQIIDAAGCPKESAA